MQRSEEVAHKLDAVRSWLAQEGLGAVALASQNNISWITAGGRSHIATDQRAGVCAVVVTRGGAYVVTPNIEFTRLIDEELEGSFEPISYPWHTPEAALATIEKLSDGSSVVGDLSSLGLPAAPGTFVELRRRLLPPEIDRYRLLGRDAAQAVEDACLSAGPGVTEHEVAARLDYECRRRDILAIVNLVAADERIAAYRHPLPTGRTLERIVLVALTGRRHGLHASLTRIISFGSLEPTRQTRHRSAMLIDATMISSSRPGTTLGAVFQAAMDKYESEGFPGEWERHHQGGLTGYSGREVFATPEGQYALRPSQALAWNPSITGTKSEDTVLISQSGHEVVTRTGTWPERRIEVAGGEVVRPEIMVRESS